MNATVTQEAPRTGVWAIEPMHSTIGFKLSHHSVATFCAGFSELSGSFDAALGKLEGEVTTASVQVPFVKLREHLQTSDFFDAEKYPVIRFESTSLQESAGRLEVAGKLTIKGVARDVQAVGAIRGPVEVRHPDGSGAEHLGMDLSVTIDRRDYGMTLNMPLPGGDNSLGWLVTIDAALELVAH